MKDEIIYINKLKSNKTLFEKEFNQIEKYYILSSKKEIHEFIEKNPGIIVILNALKPHLEKDFSESEYEIHISYDPEIENDIKLVLTINVDDERFKNGIGDDIREKKKKIHPLKRKINLLRELLIIPGVLNV